MALLHLHHVEEAKAAHIASTQIWASTLPAYAMGGKPPDPPELPEILRGDAGTPAKSDEEHKQELLDLIAKLEAENT